MTVFRRVSHLYATKRSVSGPLAFALSVAAGMALSSQPVQAQAISRAEADLLGALDTRMETMRKDLTQLKIGVGGVLSALPNATEAKTTFSVLPLFSFQYRETLAVDETQVRLNFLTSDSTLGAAGWRAGPMVKIDPGRGTISTPRLRGLGRVGVGVEVGGFVSYSLGPARIRARVRQDVANGHGGTVADFDLKSGIYKHGDFGVAAQIETSLVSHKYMQAFYGVNAAQSARTGLRIYDPSPGFKDVKLTMMAEYKFNPHWSMVGAVQYVRPVGDAFDSPIVRNRGSQNRVNVGTFVVYTFNANQL